MRKLVPQVRQPARVRLRHVVIAGACVWGGLLGLRHELREHDYPRREITLDNERQILEEFARWPRHECPRGIEDFTIQRDPYGDEYRVLCDPGSDRVTLAVLSLGSEDVGADDAVVTSQTFSR